MKTILCLMGPTASGKSTIALKLYEQLPCEIVSVDSVMVYRLLDIGSAKPSTEILNHVPHHLIDIRDPHEIYSAGQFQRDVNKIIDDICARGKIPLLVGGTMLYYKALFNGLAQLPLANQDLRDEINQRAEQLGWPALHQELAQYDAITAARLAPNDSQRIQRALEVYYLSSKPFSSFQINVAETTDRQYVNVALQVPRPLLCERIAERFDQMLSMGLIDEVNQLYQQEHLHAALPAMRAVGYRQVWEYLKGNDNYDHMREKAIIATRQLAKRQMTWLRSFKDIHWIDGESHDVVKAISKRLPVSL